MDQMGHKMAYNVELQFLAHKSDLEEELRKQFALQVTQKIMQQQEEAVEVVEPARKERTAMRAFDPTEMMLNEEGPSPRTYKSVPSYSPKSARNLTTRRSNNRKLPAISATEKTKQLRE